MSLIRIFCGCTFLAVGISSIFLDAATVRTRTLEQRRGQEAKVTKVDVGVYFNGPYASVRGPYGSSYDPYAYSYPYYDTTPYTYPYYNRYYYYPYGPSYHATYHRWNRW